jgi:hypothetical protein
MPKAEGGRLAREASGFQSRIEGLLVAAFLAQGILGFGQGEPMQLSLRDFPAARSKC